MGRRLPAAALCGGRAATRVRRKRVQRATYSSPSSKLPAAALPSSSGGKKAGSAAAAAGGAGGGCYVNGNGALMVQVGSSNKDGGGGRRVMVLADGRAEAAGALQWALSQAVRSNDTVVLLAVAKPPVARDAASDSCVKMLGTKSQQHLAALRTVCESTRPEVKVETCAVEAEERAPAVVDAARRHGASLLVLGQRPRRHAVARWLQQVVWRRRRSRGSSAAAAGGGSMVEYCIEHAPCVALAVRRRSSGGYLVSSKHHRDFWLLA
ncbi:unnamed protein product [Miscanthus lutarioriparius]|uniref:UspA domain-containing protein n=1 Tax=Miscanthus lutarioriparius TaxID=422564 RepID=A0A811N1V0_9POAL|nr:unnamed protein product [Miscanthus lutarioriparius]